MLDIQFIRDNPEKVKKAVKSRGCDITVVDRFLRVDETRRQLIAEVQKWREERNKLTKSKIGFSKASATEGKRIKEMLRRLEPDLKAVEEESKNLLYEIPNLPSEDTPLGKGEADNLEIKAWIPIEGYLPKNKLGTGWISKKYMPDKPPHAIQKDFKPKPYYLLGDSLGIDMKQAALVSGSRFTYLKGEVVILLYAIFDFLKSKLVKENFTPMVVPLLVKDWPLYGTSHFPQGRDQVYRISNENVEEKETLNLIGSSEPSLFAYFGGKILKYGELPAKVFAQTSCFRSEVGSWGKDVRGIKRNHQFDKVEMDVVCRSDQSEEVFDYLLGINEWLLQSLELPYRLWLKSTADMGYHASYKQCDFEAWLPASQEFIEEGTDTNATDYQARRMNVKYKDKDGTKKFCHTVNDTGVATRILLAILENYQQKDGSVAIPKVLQKYTGKKVILPNR
ncbi:MAG TPA: serine--tRNA ligase [Candidatus Bathyarchaeia archaeon]|nr:serine--tRNA ligase [Candidatus Bathyarchaeia archaeon]